MMTAMITTIIILMLMTMPVVMMMKTRGMNNYRQYKFKGLHDGLADFRIQALLISAFNERCNHWSLHGPLCNHCSLAMAMLRQCAPCFWPSLVCCIWRTVHMRPPGRGSG
jgi:hypothetical protein